jgi:transcriptional regulator with XRE-family HTH domain
MIRVRRVLAQALDAATPTLRDIARSAQLGYEALRKYRLGDRTPTAETLRQLARALRHQAQRVLRFAEHLEREADRNR